MCAPMRPLLFSAQEKAVAHARCRMVCYVCLSDKRAFRPPPMFCEKCFTAIHQRWSYWEEGGDEGGLKLCKRCYADIKASSQPNRILSDLAHRSNLQVALAAINARSVTGTVGSHCAADPTDALRDGRSSCSWKRRRRTAQSM